MAVPKKKTSVSRKGKRHAGQHHKLTARNVGECNESGEYTLRHHVSPGGYYKGNKIYTTRAEKAEAKAATDAE